MNKPNKTQQGFTLVELIIVIVILGILAVTAAPKFLNVAGDARGGTLQAVLGSVTTANSLVNAKAKIQGNSETVDEQADRFVFEGDEKIFLAFGYPVTSTVADITIASVDYVGLDDSDAVTNMWTDLIDVNTNDFTVDTALVDTDTGFLVDTGTTTTATIVEAVVVYPADFTLDTDAETEADNSCYVYVAQAAASGNKPKAAAVTTGCSN